MKSEKKRQSSIIKQENSAVGQTKESNLSNPPVVQ